MLVKRLTLTHFRGLTNATLDFTPGFNLIVGINGAGKTSVLEALRILLAHALPNLTSARPVPGIGLAANDITVGHQQTTLELKLTCHGQDFTLPLTEQRESTRSNVKRDAGFKSIGETDADQQAQAEGIRREHTSLRQGKRPTQGDPRLEGTLRGQTNVLPNVSGELDPRPDKAIRKRKPEPLVLYLSVRRAITNMTPGKGGTAHQGSFAIDRGLEAGKVLNWWRSKAALAKEAPTLRSAKQLDATRAALERLLPHLKRWEIREHKLTVERTVQIDTLNSTTGQPEVKTETRRLPIEFLSDGERSLIAIGVEISCRLADLNDQSDLPLEEGSGVVLIDELDLHLHPQWQRTVIESLRSAFPKLQFICSTHSLFLIQSQRHGNLIRLDREGDEEEPAEHYHHKSIEDIAEEVQGVVIPQRSQRYLDMMAVAEEYYSLLRHSTAEQQGNDQLLELKRRLDELVMPFSDDPAFQALLKQERILKLGAEE